MQSRYSLLFRGAAQFVLICWLVDLLCPAELFVASGQHLVPYWVF